MIKMSEILDDKAMMSNEQTDKVYNEQAILFGTFIGGPLVTGFFMAENFRALDQKAKIRITWIITILFSIVLGIITFSIPESWKIPNQLIPLSYTGLAFGLYKYFQGKPIDSLVKNGGQLQSWGKIILVSVIGMIVTVALIVGIGHIWDTIDQRNLANKEYGTSVVHEIAYYKNKVSESEVDRIADALTETGFFDDYVAKYVFLKKDGNKYVVHTSVVKGTQHDPEALEHFIRLQKDLDNAIPENDIVLKLIVDYIDNVVKTIE